MPMMIVSEEDFVKERAKFSLPLPSPPKLEIIPIEHGRNKGDNNIPQPLREIIAEEALSGTPAKILTEQFGVSPSQVAAFKHSASSTATYNQPNDKLVNVRERVGIKAHNRLNDALNALAKKNLVNEKPKDIASIAKDMAAVADKIRPMSERGNNQNLHLHIHAPQQKKVSDFEIIDG